MGVPVFFKWLSMRNPKFVVDVHQPQQQAYDSGNPYVDNFYIDMNGLIHPSVNPKGQKIKQPETFQQQCQNIFEYVDKLMNIIRPKKLLYLAIDGVAPRAKMNQQRSRRFRAVLQGDQMKEKKNEIFLKYKEAGAVTPQLDQFVNKKGFNSNLITPGTQFLSSVCTELRKYISQRLANHKLWKNIAVIFSDSNCPGQGQHKIMQFIRQQRASQDYPTNQSHCIYGADADLIMLTLATHQPKFYIIRQVVITANDKWCTSCGKRGHYFLDCVRAQSIQQQQKVAEKINAGNIQVQFQILKIKTVRQFLHLYYSKSNIPFGYNLERIIDDFVFLCFFVGNDFLPHIPCLSIRDGGIDVIMKVYQYCLELMPDYINDSGQINEDCLKILISQLCYYQQQIIQQLVNKQYNQKLRQNMDKNVQNLKKAKQKPKNKVYLDKQIGLAVDIDFEDPLSSFKQQIQNLINPQLSLEDYSVFGHNVYTYKQKYYREKFKVKPHEFLQLKHNMSKSYIEALKWICHYYYKGVASWSWFYPFHYSPFFTDINVIQTQPFELGYPFKPFEQLMAVFPAKTYEALPQCLRPLMTDPDSPISDYFPILFKIDTVGKKFAWLGQVLLPFLDQNRLLTAMGDYQKKLTQQQKLRNYYHESQLFISKYGKLGRQICQKFKKNQCQILSNQISDYCLQGKICLKQIVKLNRDDQVYHYEFIAPCQRKHQCRLKLEEDNLQDLNDQIINRTDKKAFGGQRFVRVIQRIFGRRGGFHNIKKNVQYQNNNNRTFQRKDNSNRNFYQNNNNQQRFNSYPNSNNFNPNFNNTSNNNNRNNRYQNNNKRNNQMKINSNSDKQDQNNFNFNQKYQNQQQNNQQKSPKKQYHHKKKRQPSSSQQKDIKKEDARQRSRQKRQRNDYKNQ